MVQERDMVTTVSNKKSLTFEANSDDARFGTYAA